MFDGARADLTKSLSMNPVFQVTHTFSLASQTSLPSYNFGAVFANQKVSYSTSSHASSFQTKRVRVIRFSSKEVSIMRVSSTVDLMPVGHQIMYQSASCRYVNTLFVYIYSKPKNNLSCRQTEGWET